MYAWWLFLKLLPTRRKVTKHKIERVIVGGEVIELYPPQLSKE